MSNTRCVGLAFGGFLQLPQRLAVENEPTVRADGLLDRKSSKLVAKGECSRFRPEHPRG
jgi:hypothetical protein